MALATGCRATRPAAPAAGGPLVIGHRGAPGHVPEHTLRSYSLAIELGADAIEPDLVVTKDGVLIARHENEISKTTDAAERFPGRRRVKIVDGARVEGWFAEDFTLAEIKTLRAKERLAFRSHAEDGKHAIPTFDEIAGWARAEEGATGRRIGLVPEMKHPTYFRSIGLPIEERLAEALEWQALVGRSTHVMVQCFEPSALRRLRRLADVSTIQLLGEPSARPFDQIDLDTAPSYGAMASGIGLAAVRTYADWVSPPKETLLRDDGFVARAHAAGLKVVPYTFRSDREFLPKEYGADPAKEYDRFFAMGVDAVFSDFPDHAAAARARFRRRRPPSP